MIKIRWVFAALALTGLTVAGLSGFALSVWPLILVCTAILIYNSAFAVVARWLGNSDKPNDRPLLIFTNVQISCDLVSLFAAVCLSGGMASPFLIFALFHVIVAGILLPPASPFIYGGIVLLAVALLAFAQQFSAMWLPKLEPLVQVLEIQSPFGSVIFQYLTFSVAILFSVFLTTSFRMSLQAKGRSLLAISKELDVSNARLMALYEMIKEIGKHSSFKELLDAATSGAARLMGVKACSIKLLDEQKKYLEFASTYGLSEDYLSKGKLDLSQSPINRAIIEGKPYVIGRIEEKDYFQYPEDIEREGISSMLCVPLRGNNVTLGVFCIYSRRHYLFDQKDVDFISLLCDLTGVAIERVKWDLTKSWFMAKVTHNLRAPVGAVLSMVKLIQKGYLGPVNEKQNEILERCEIRLGILADLISDLLRIGRERTEVGKTRLDPVPADKVLKALEPMFTDQAVQKGIGITFDIRQSGLCVLANDTILEDLFTNLISNAVKYTPAGGSVKVVLGMEDEGRIRFEVSDTGIGISEEDIPKLFTEFYRTERAKQLVEEGTGLGMVIVKEIVDRLGGTISVASREDEGTCLTCMIPGLSAVRNGNS